MLHQAEVFPPSYLGLQDCRRSTDPETSTGIASLSANPLLSIADRSLEQCISSNDTDFDYASSHIELSNDVFDNADNNSEDADVNEISFMSFKPSQTK